MTFFTRLIASFRFIYTSTKIYFVGIVLALGLIAGVSVKNEKQSPIIPVNNGYKICQDTIPYAILYFYRSYIPKLNAPLKKVPIYINDSLVYELKANMIIPIRVIKEGRYNISVDKKGETEITTKIKMGQEYFFKCAVEKGLWFGKPAIESISVKEGKIDAGLIKPGDEK